MNGRATAGPIPPAPTPAGLPPLAHGTLRQAAEWFAVLQDEPADPQARQRWLDWLAAHPDHQRAWQAVQAISSQFDPSRRLQPAAKRAASHALDQAAHHGGQRRRALRTLAAMAVCGTAGLLAARYVPPVRRQLASQGWDWQSDHNTGVGQTRQLHLADGTRLWLAPRTAIDLAEAADAQQGPRIVLHQGEILVDTGRPALPAPAHRPELTVVTHLASLRPLGTRFSVRARDRQCTLSVFGGSVAVHPGTAAAAAAEQIVPGGWQTDIGATGIGRSRPVEEARQSWAKGLLLADDMRLADWVAELSLYRPGHLACDPAIADLRVAGGYPLHDTDRALALLMQALPIRVRYTLPWWVQIEPQAG